MSRPPPMAPLPSGSRSDNEDRPLWQRLAWMVGLWSASVVTLLALATLLRWVLRT